MDALDHAAAHFKRLGYTITAREHRTRFGTIDLIASNGTALVFAQVTERLASSDEPAREVIRRCAAAYLALDEKRPRADNLRFDAIAVTLDASGDLLALDHLEGAF